jgi:Hypothetical protein (DUF2513)
MKRDMDLIRIILLEVERLGRPTVGDQTIESDVEGRSDQEIDYHLWLMVEAGWIDAQIVSNQHVHTQRRVKPRRLTHDGHDFLDVVRDADTWRNTKEGVLKAGGWTFDIIKDLAKSFIKKKLEDNTGMKL